MKSRWRSSLSTPIRSFHQSAARSLAGSIPRVRIEATNFREVSPLLKEIRVLIIEGDGSGRGKLRLSGYEAEPATIVFDTPFHKPTMESMQMGSG